MDQGTALILAWVIGIILTCVTFLLLLNISVVVAFLFLVADLAAAFLYCANVASKGALYSWWKG